MPQGGGGGGGRGGGGPFMLQIIAYLTLVSYRSKLGHYILHTEELHLMHQIFLTTDVLNAHMFY